jgi:hypothetical protein
MRPRTSLCCAAVVALIAVAGCQDTSAPSSSVEPNASSVSHAVTVSSDLVPTPDGWYHRGCVFAVPNASHVDVHGVVTRSDGTRYMLSGCTQPGRVASGPASPGAPSLSGWLESAQFDPGTNWGTINAAWRVPPVPRGVYDSSQVFFAFPGLQSSQYILQPVLTYGYAADYGGQYWTATSWRCNSGSDCHHGDQILSLSPGDSVVGSVVASACAAGVCTWTVTTADVTTGARGRVHIVV